MIEIPASVDLDLLAFDIADRIGDCDNYKDLDLSQDDIRRELPAFLTACLRNADAAAGADPLAYVSVDDTVPELAPRDTEYCLAEFGGGFRCTRDVHSTRWRHIAAVPSGRVVAIDVDGVR